jgi:hypothetical protein
MTARLAAALRTSTDASLNRNNRIDVYRLELATDGSIIRLNKTRQGYALRSTLKLAGYFFLRSSHGDLHRAL